VTARLTYLVSHPIQYQAPLLRRIASEPGIELQVLFERIPDASGAYDAGFGRRVAWDLPLTDGYDFLLAKSISAVKRALRQTDVLWLHGWNSFLKLRALDAARRMRVPVLMRAENTLSAMPDGTGLRGIFKRLYVNWIFRRCAGFLCVGSDNRRYYEAHDLEASRLFFMPYAVDNDVFRTQADEAMASEPLLRGKLGLDPGRPVILFAGKLQRRKHPETLLDAFSRLDRDALGQPYLLYIGDGELSQILQGMARRYGDDVRLLGFRNQTEMPAFYSLADVFVLASECEPWGLAVNEAMNGGAAVIVSDCCGCAADLVDETCGAVVPAADAVALTSTLTDILAVPGRAAAMGAVARTRIAEWGFCEDLKGLRSALEAVT